MAQRPRASILSLFDPLSLSPGSDKENNVGEVSFFHPPDSRKVQPALHTLRRRLIDVGDMTVDEPNIHDLLDDEDDFDALNAGIAEDDDGDTLTWRDMAKAASPKWPARHATSLTTPKASPTPRTPLAEIFFKDETTPVARKKPYRRQIIPAASKLSQMDHVAESSHALSPSSCEKILKTPTARETSFPSRSTPSIEISDVDVGTQGAPAGSNFSGEVLGSSVCTLNLPPPTGALIADTSIPISISPSSSQSSSSPNALLCLPLPTQAKLRPNLHSQTSMDNRLSVDLQSSFQLHLSSSDAKFDLLNEKISFFSSKDGMDSFLNNLEVDNSFGEDEFAFVQPTVEKINDSSPETSSPAPPNLISPVMKEKPAHHPAVEPRPSPLPEVTRIFIPELPPKPTTIKVVTQGISSTVPKALSNPVRSRASIDDPRTVKIASGSPRSSVDEKELSILSTPSSSSGLQHPPRPVPALRIVKRSKVLSRRLSTATTTTKNFSNTSSVSTVIEPVARTKTNPSLPSSPIISDSKRADAPQPVRAVKRTAAPSFSNATLSGDGPRRVLISEGPKLNYISGSRVAAHPEQAKPSSAVSGPRRVAVAPTDVVEKPTVLAKPVLVVQAGAGLKQPVRYATVGPVSAIPKPVSRTAGSRLPAPVTSKARFGVPAAGAPGKGLLSRRVT
ncbi:hypothetical protein BDZ97DRAFT_1775886 [Flammula alnicola]|nr:hypothetical protein BDZ97DRAFT_1775886 [Flammula alnicola]